MPFSVVGLGRGRSQHQCVGGVFLVVSAAEPRRGPPVPAARGSSWPGCIGAGSRQLGRDLTPEARHLLAESCDAHLLIEHVRDRFRFHDLLRAYAYQLAETDPERHEATHRMLDHYLHTARSADC